MLIFDKTLNTCLADIDECATNKASCPGNTTCVNDLGDYHCECLPNYRKKNSSVFTREKFDKEACVGK